ncbi:MAG TPA: hypothetical protein VJ983_08520, partial [candidate division Zixibacteria bacterium]|nr:hypothetical protein [candidate division Zixibacteria bacterium]
MDLTVEHSGLFTTHYLAGNLDQNNVSFETVFELHLNTFGYKVYCLFWVRTGDMIWNRSKSGTAKIPTADEKSSFFALAAIADRLRLLLCRHPASQGNLLAEFALSHSRRYSFILAATEHTCIFSRYGTPRCETSPAGRNLLHVD